MNDHENSRRELEHSQIEGIRREMAAFKELMLAMRASDKEALAIALVAADRAVTKAEIANEKRLDLLNEYRTQTRETVADYVRQDVYGPQHELLRGEVNAVADRVASIEGRFLGLAGVSAIIAGVVAIYGLLTR